MSEGSVPVVPAQDIWQVQFYPVLATAREGLVDEWPKHVRRPRNLDWVVVPRSAPMLGEDDEGYQMAVAVPHTPLAAHIVDGVVVQFLQLEHVPLLIQLFFELDKE